MLPLTAGLKYSDGFKTARARALVSEVLHGTTEFLQRKVATLHVLPVMYGQVSANTVVSI